VGVSLCVREKESRLLGLGVFVVCSPLVFFGRLALLAPPWGFFFLEVVMVSCRRSALPAPVALSLVALSSSLGLLAARGVPGGGASCSPVGVPGLFGPLVAVLAAAGAAERAVLEGLRAAGFEGDVTRSPLFSTVSGVRLWALSCLNRGLVTGYAVVIWQRALEAAVLPVYTTRAVGVGPDVGLLVEGPSFTDLDEALAWCPLGYRGQQYVCEVWSEAGRLVGVDGESN